MGGTTSSLMSLARDITEAPGERELDRLLSTGEMVSTSLLCMALQSLGLEAISLSGRQCGILTDSTHFNACVERVDTGRILRELESGRVVVAAGFQGIGPDQEVTTLGLGGSDTTAVVLAGALAAAECEICSDVDGIYSADPRIVEDASLIAQISYDEMLTLSRHGASVLNPTAVAQARDHDVAIRSRHANKPGSPGTLVHGSGEHGPRVIGIAAHESVLPLTFNGSGRERKLPKGVARADLVLDRHDSGSGRREIAIPAERIPDPEGFAERIDSHHGEAIAVGDPCSSVSAVGMGVGAAPQLKELSDRAFAQTGVDTRLRHHAENAITYLVKPDHASELMNAFHGVFRCTAAQTAA
jgi:aspartate kinase